MTPFKVASAEPWRRNDETTTAMDMEIAIEEEEIVDSTQPTRPTPTSRATNALAKLIESDTDSGDEKPAQPRRKLLAVLQPQLSEDSSDSEDDDKGQGAYERVRAQLMSGTGQQDAQKTSQHIATVPSISSSDDDKEMLSRATPAHRLGVRKEKEPSPRPSPTPSVRSRPSSPGLFVTPNGSPVKKTPSRVLASAASDSDIPAQLMHNADLDDRVKRIRAERKAQQSKTRNQEKRAEKASRRVNRDSDSDPDGETGRRLTQQARPTRKASKKALEDISREQQRISRNMQLTHQAKTRKRYTTKDLLATFGYNQTDEEPTVVAQLPTPNASSTLASSDAEVNQIHDTPPMNSPSQGDAVAKDDTATFSTTLLATKIPHVKQVTSSPRAKLDKGKGRAPEFQHLPLNPLVEQTHSVTTHLARIELMKPTTSQMVELSDSDEDLEIVKPESRFPVFDRLPQKKEQEAPSLLHLRHLAHLTTSDNTRRPKSGQNLMSITALQISLAQKARQQATREREEKLEDLRRRGIYVETEEEHEKQQLEIEDMVAQFEKARQEDLKLSKLERGEAKKNGETIGDELLSSDEDEDYVGSGEENNGETGEVDGLEEEDELEELYLSGSEEEHLDDEADDEEELEEEDTAASNGLIDGLADNDDKDEEMEDATASAAPRTRNVNRARNVIVDDEDESESEALRESTPTQRSPQSPQPTQDNVMNAFGFNNVGSTLGLTQVFAGTMANLESDSQTAHPLDKEPEQDSLDFLRGLPDTQPEYSQASDMLVPNSQALDSQQESLAGPVSQFNFGISQLIETSPTFSHTQLSEMPEPTQDVGFGLSRSPAGLVPPPSTIDTVMMAVAESPIMKRKGKLQQRKNRFLAEESEVHSESTAAESDLEDDQDTTKAADVFAAMTEAAKKKHTIDDFNKKTSWAKDAVDEQAEESEDEYAGIGGADGEDSDEDDEELAKMIDTSDVKVDERKMAAFFAAKSKAEDEKNIEKLYKDVMHGGFRRRQGGDAFNMSDSEDEAEQQRRKKQMQFKKMTRALISDDRIGQIAQNPKKTAFFNTLADHMDDPDYEFLNAPEMDFELDASQSQSQSGDSKDTNHAEISIPDSQLDATASSSNPLKRKSLDSQEKENRPPPNLRRTAATETTLARKPISFSDVQTSVMELLDDPRVIVPDSQFSASESESEETTVETKPRRRIIDRLTLTRTASMESEAGAGSHLAFHAPSASTGPGFRVPALIRRATSKLSEVSTTTSGVKTPTEGAVRRGGTDRSNIHAQAREAERRTMLEKKDRKREESLKKKVKKGIGRRSILKDLGGGFE